MSILSNMIRQVVRALRRGGPDGYSETAAELRPLRARFPALAGLADAASAGRGQLTEAYGSYVASVSSPQWAISLQTAAVLHGLCTLLRPQRALDLGSGFSSFTLRGCAPEGSVVHSVDEDPQWLARTRDFLSGNGLRTEGLFVWSEFEGRAGETYDLILHDMGRLELRLAALPRALALAAAEGIVVLDDMHEPEYAARAVACCKGAGFEICSLRALTLDEFGRYAGVAFRPHGT